MNLFIALLLMLPILASCGREPAVPVAAERGAAPVAEFERGPHRGRMLRDGDFALEVTIFETNVPPQFRLYAYQDGKPVSPGEVQPTIELSRLDGEKNQFTFTAEQDYLTGSGTVHEPHSFDVTVSATHGGRSHSWTYASYEGRTTIPSSAAEAAGLKAEAAGPAVIRDTVRLLGTVAIDANRRAAVKARFAGIVREVPVQEGQRVKRGQTLVVVEGNDSLRTYSVTAPFDGVVLTRNTNVGDVATDHALVELADLSQVWVDLRAIGTDADRLRSGQRVEIASVTSDAKARSAIQRVMPVATSGQGVIARVSIANPEGTWRPGMTVSAEVTLASRQVPLAVKESGLQGFRDFIVVFAQVGETYEVRMLELGQRDGQYAEVLGGIKPGQIYVTEQSYLIRADIEKSGASHDH